MNKKIILVMISAFFLTITGCNDEYDVSGPLTDDEAKVMNVFIDGGVVFWTMQRSFYDHDSKVVTVRVVPGTITAAEYANMVVWINPSFQAIMSPLGGEKENWSSGSRTYTITSGDGKTTNVYTIRIVEDLIL